MCIRDRGKTHLLYAISNEITKNNPNTNAIYIKGEDFTNELIEAIKSETTIAFHNKYRQADILLVDDIQFIEMCIRDSTMAANKGKLCNSCLSPYKVRYPNIFSAFI